MLPFPVIEYLDIFKAHEQHVVAGGQPHQTTKVTVIAQSLRILVIPHLVTEALLVFGHLGCNSLTLRREVFGYDDVEIVEILAQDGVEQRCPVVGGDTDGDQGHKAANFYRLTRFDEVEDSQ